MRQIIIIGFMCVFLNCSEDKRLNQIGNGFSTIIDNSCLCPSLIQTIENSNSHIVLLHNIDYIVGNSKSFIVRQKSGSDQSYFWVQSKYPFYKEDFIPLYSDVKSFMDTMVIDFKYEYSSRN